LCTGRGDGQKMGSMVLSVFRVKVRAGGGRFMDFEGDISTKAMQKINTGAIMTGGERGISTLSLLMM